jgi:protein-S-isoprenylcysteine O-methyltransferase Ste14
VLSAVLGVAIVIRGWTWSEVLAVFPYLAFEGSIIIFGLFQGRARAWASFSESRGGEIFLPILGTWLYPIVVALYGASTGPSTYVFPLIYLWLAWSILSLGKNFSVLPEARALAQRGPYQIVRHPMYLGYCALWIAWAAGFGFAVLPWIWAALGILLYFYRARVEERKLRAFVPGYAEYSEKVPGLIPFSKSRKLS